MEHLFYLSRNGIFNRSSTPTFARTSATWRTSRMLASSIACWRRLRVRLETCSTLPSWRIHVLWRGRRLSAIYSCWNRPISFGW